MKQQVYVVTMYRWGDRTKHSYVIGVFSTKTKSEKAGLKEKEERGGNKYYPETIEMQIDIPGECKQIGKLEKNTDFAS